MKASRLKQEVAAVVKRLREEAGLSQPSLGRRAGVTGKTVWRTEAGIKELRLYTFIRLAEALEIDPASLLLAVYEAAKPSRNQEPSWTK